MTAQNPGPWGPYRNQLFSDISLQRMPKEFPDWGPWHKGFSDPNTLAFWIGNNNTLGSKTLRTVPDILTSEGYGTIAPQVTACLTSHAGGGFSPYDIPEDVYGPEPDSENPQAYFRQNALWYAAFDYGVMEDGHIQFVSVITPKGGMPMDYEMGGGNLYLFIPRALTPSPIDYRNYGAYLTLSGKYGPGIFASTGSDIPDYPPLYRKGQLEATLAKFTALMRQIPEPFNHFRRQPLYTEIGRDLWPINFPDPILSVLEVMLVQDDPLAWLRSVTDRDKASIFAHRLHDSYKALFQIFPDYRRPNSYAIRRKFMANYTSVDDLPEPEQDVGVAKQTT